MAIIPAAAMWCSAMPAPSPANIDLSSLDGRNGFTLNGVAAYDFSGSWAASAGDINGDGFADLAVGAYGADPHGEYSGAGYVVFGHASKAPSQRLQRRRQGRHPMAGRRRHAGGLAAEWHQRHRDWTRARQSRRAILARSGWCQLQRR